MNFMNIAFGMNRRNLCRYCQSCDDGNDAMMSSMNADAIQA